MDTHCHTLLASVPLFLLLQFNTTLNTTTATPDIKSCFRGSERLFTDRDCPEGYVRRVVDPQQGSFVSTPELTDGEKARLRSLSNTRSAPVSGHRRTQQDNQNKCTKLQTDIERLSAKQRDGYTLNEARTLKQEFRDLKRRFRKEC